jgi:hypothetical protein
MENSDDCVARICNEEVVSEAVVEEELFSTKVSSSYSWHRIYIYIIVM